MDNNQRFLKVVVYSRSIAEIGRMIYPLMVVGYDFDAFFLPGDFAEYARAISESENKTDILIIGEIDERYVDSLNDWLSKLQSLREAGSLVIINVANGEDGRDPDLFDVNFVVENGREFKPDRDTLTISNNALLRLTDTTRAELQVPNLM